MRNLFAISFSAFACTFAAQQAKAEFPLYQVVKVQDWWGPYEPSGFGTTAWSINNANTVLALDLRSGEVATYHLQTWDDGQRTDAGSDPFPAGYEFTGTAHLRNFDDNGRLAMDIYNPAQDILGMAIC